MDIIISPLQQDPTRGLCLIKARRAMCALGRNGCAATKLEGDGKTPYGEFPLRRLWYRADRIEAALLPKNFPRQALAPDHIWSDDPQDPNYNRCARAPSKFSHERLWREDALYDAFFELGFNDAPVRRGGGSAIFLHLANFDFTPTEGCIAIAWPLMRYLLGHVRTGDRAVIRPRLSVVPIEPPQS